MHSLPRRPRAIPLGPKMPKPLMTRWLGMDQRSFKMLILLWLWRMIRDSLVFPRPLAVRTRRYRRTIQASPSPVMARAFPMERLTTELSSVAQM